MKVIEEEIFARVVSLLPFDQIAQAVETINALAFGLSAGVFTNNLGNGLPAARLIKTSAVHLNETASSRLDGMPCGGIKDGGFGRERLRHAMREMTDEKRITLSLSGAKP